MYSIKPSRSASRWGCAGTAFAGLFMLAIGIAATNDGAPPIFGFFGVGAFLFCLVGGILHLRDAVTSDRRSLFYIVDSKEEPGQPTELLAEPRPATPARYCTQCGTKAAPNHAFCGKCGSRFL